MPQNAFSSQTRDLLVQTTFTEPPNSRLGVLKCCVFGYRRLGALQPQPQPIVAHQPWPLLLPRFADHTLLLRDRAVHDHEAAPAADAGHGK